MRQARSFSDLSPEWTDRTTLAARQEERLRRLFAGVLPTNRFYAAKLAAAGIAVELRPELADLVQLPFTTKAELVADQGANPPFGTNLTYPIEQYCRLNQTSGTHGKPLRWLDTAQSWSNLLGCWKIIFQIAGVCAADRLFFPFSFGPFLGFWTAFEAAQQIGCLVIPAGGMSTGARLNLMLETQATVVCCTPTYALHLAEEARRQNLDLAASPARMLIVAGEPGGSIPATRSRLEQEWGARVIDHSGLTEVGPMAVECLASPGHLHVLETEYIAEVIDPTTYAPVLPGLIGELIATNLGRDGSPLIRYRTGDLVRVAREPCPCGLAFLKLEGGILGRTDDMIHVRGNNLYPTALEAIIRRFADVVEYRVTVDRTGALTALGIEVEPTPATEGPMLAERISHAIRDELLFRVDVVSVPPGTLPRFEMKARRIVWKSAQNGVAPMRDDRVKESLSK